VTRSLTLGIVGIYSLRAISLIELFDGDTEVWNHFGTRTRRRERDAFWDMPLGQMPWQYSQAEV